MGLVKDHDDHPVNQLCSALFWKVLKNNSWRSSKHS